MSLRVVQADLGDPAHAGAIVELIDQYASEPIGGGQGLDPVARQRLVPGLRERPNARVWLALEDEAALGVAVCFVGFSTFRARPLINIHDLAVRAGCRGRGIGRALIEAVAAHARTLDCCKLTLEVREDNENALALYAKTGFGVPAAGGTATRFLEKPL